MRLVSPSCAALVVVAAALVSVNPAVAATVGDAGCDFDGDGYADLAVGVPGWTGEDELGSGTGAVSVRLGSPSGLGSSEELWHRDRHGVTGEASRTDGFANSVACGDFDGDGFDELAVGAPFDAVGEVFRAGSVTVIGGTAAGLHTSGNQLWHQDRAGVKGVAEEGDQFGSRLAVGDFDGDGTDDLAIGVPHDGPGSTGAVQVLYGSSTGLSATDDLWSQASPGIAGQAERNDAFGTEVAVGDFDGDGHDDLAVGTSAEDDDAGAVNVLYGSGSGLDAAGDQIWHQDRPGAKGAAESGDWFGRSLATGDFDGDGHDDLAVGVPREAIGEVDSAGIVQVFFGGPNGVTARDQVLHQDLPGVVGTVEAGDEFGSGLAAGDFDGDGRVDLAVGVARESLPGVLGAGAVGIFYGGPNGFSGRDSTFHQDKPGINGVADDYDLLGRSGFSGWSSMAAGDFDGDAHDDLVVGVPNDGLFDVGVVHVVHGESNGLGTRDQLLEPTDPVGRDRFGAAVAG